MSNLTKEYTPETRFGGDKFGRGRYDSYRFEATPQAAPRESALRLAWSNGCPIAGELTDPNSRYSLEWMVKRYADTNTWYNAAVFEARGNKAVQDWLTTPRFRLANEPVGHHEPQSVPRSHQWKISPMSGIDGYATPRLAIEIRDQLKGNEGHNTAFEVLWNVAKEAGNEPGIYLALLAETAVNFGVQPERVLHHVYPAGILSEENCKVTFWKLAETLDQHAPIVWKTYMDLPTKTKKIMEIAELPQLA